MLVIQDLICDPCAMTRAAGICQQAGDCPAASNFLLLHQKKVTKEKATPLSATPFACAAGATCGARSSRGRARPRCAQTIARPQPSGLPLLGAARRSGWSRDRKPKTKPGSDEDALCASSSARIRICPPPRRAGPRSAGKSGSGQALV